MPQSFECYAIYHNGLFKPVVIEIENPDTLARLKKQKSEIGTLFDGDHIIHVKPKEIISAHFLSNKKSLTCKAILLDIYSFRLNLKECDL